MRRPCTGVHQRVPELLWRGELRQRKKEALVSLLEELRVDDIGSRVMTIRKGEPGGFQCYSQTPQSTVEFSTLFCSLVCHKCLKYCLAQSRRPINTNQIDIHLFQVFILWNSQINGEGGGVAECHTAQAGLTLTIQPKMALNSQQSYLHHHVCFRNTFFPQIFLTHGLLPLWMWYMI